MFSSRLMAKTEIIKNDKRVPPTLRSIFCFINPKQIPCINLPITNNQPRVWRNTELNCWYSDMKKRIKKMGVFSIRFPCPLTARSTVSSSYFLYLFLPILSWMTRMARKIVHSPKIDVKNVVCGKVIVMFFSMIFKLGLPKTYICQILDLRSMDWANRFTFAGFTVTYCTFQMAWEVIEKKDDYEVAFRWFSSKQKAEDFCLGRLGGK